MIQTYLDYSATTPVCEAAAATCADILKNQFGNPSSLYRLGLDAENLVSAARKAVAKGLDCDPSCLYFTGSATESDNIAIFGALSANPRRGKKIVTTAVEHAAVLGPFREMAKRGYTVSFLSPDDSGHYSPEAIAGAVDKDTALLSVMLVNNETGLRFPIDEIIRAVRKKNPETLIHVDAVQGAFKLPFSIRRSDPDLVSVSGHKIYAPKGIGALYIKKGTRVSPLYFGGGQEKGIRPGTESVPLICAFSAAVEWYLPQRDALFSRYARLRGELLSRLSEIPEVCVNSPEDGVPYILNLSVEGIRSEIMLHFLESRGVYVSSGSACSKGEKSYVLKACGLSDRRADSALRVSLGAWTREEDIARFADGVEEGLKTLIRIR